MKQKYFKFFIGTIMFLVGNQTSLVFSHPDLGLCSRSERLEQLEQLPVSDDAFQRMYLVRHGESTANVYFEVDGKKVRYVSGDSPEIPLTEKGRTQIVELAKKLGKRIPQDTHLTITSSTALRTRQTALILFEELSKTHSNVSLEKTFYRGLNERSLGAWEGRLKDDSYLEVESVWKAQSAAEKFFTSPVEGGESYSEVASRAFSGLTEIHSQYSDSTIIAVTSFNTINAAAIQLNNLVDSLPKDPGTELPKLNLSNGDLVLLETPKNQSFENTSVVSHIKRDK